MEFPIKKSYGSKFNFYYFNYGYVSSKDLRLVVNILIKDKDTNPISYHDLVISSEQTIVEEAKAFEEKFVLEPEKYLNIKIA